MKEYFKPTIIISFLFSFFSVIGIIYYFSLLDLNTFIGLFFVNIVSFMVFSIYSIEIYQWNNGFSRRNGYPWIEQSIYSMGERRFKAESKDCTHIIELQWFTPLYNDEYAKKLDQNYSTVLSISRF